MIVLIQGTVPFMTLVFSGIKENLENNTIQMDEHMIEKSQVVLQNDMIEKWRAVYKESDGLDEKLSEILKINGISVQEFLGSEELQKSYLSKVFPGLVESLQYGTASGIYLIMGMNSQQIRRQNIRDFLSEILIRRHEFRQIQIFF